VRRLDQEFSLHLHLRPVRWEREPLRASAHPQSEIIPPHDCDIVVLVLWSTLGSSLPTDTFPGPLSGKEVTGSEWEFEDALKSHREREKPDLLVYRKTAAPSANLGGYECGKAASRRHGSGRRFLPKVVCRSDEPVPGGLLQAVRRRHGISIA
jgi:hypothetical protein